MIRMLQAVASRSGDSAPSEAPALREAERGDRVSYVSTISRAAEVPEDSGTAGDAETEGESGVASTLGAHNREARLRRLVDTYIDFVARVLRNAGSPESDIDDDIQRTYMVVARRLDDLRPGAEKSFLLQTALNIAAHARRTLARRREVPVEHAPTLVDSGTSPERLIDQKRMRGLLDDVLDAMDGDIRTVFVLYEFEDLTTAEIGRLLSVPRGTVASRLRRARIVFRERVAELEITLNAEVE